MSRFLRVGLISDGIGDIIEAASTLLATIDPHDRNAELAEILTHSETSRVPSRWSSEPTYTGEAQPTRSSACWMPHHEGRKRSSDLFRRLRCRLISGVF